MRSIVGPLALVPSVRVQSWRKTLVELHDDSTGTGAAAAHESWVHVEVDRERCRRLHAPMLDSRGKRASGKGTRCESGTVPPL